MPDESTWSSYFSPRQTLMQLGLTSACGDVLDFGCGYGTFTIPAAQMVQGTVHALDIDSAMIEITSHKAASIKLNNVRTELRDFMAQGSGLPDESVDYVMLFNILHCEQPEMLLREAWRVLSSRGQLAIMHWNHDPTTPRGPSMAIRPRPEQCRHWAFHAGFETVLSSPIDLPPYHYGWIMHKR